MDRLGKYPILPGKLGVESRSGSRWSDRKQKLNEDNEREACAVKVWPVGMKQGRQEAAMDAVAGTGTDTKGRLGRDFVNLV